MQKSLQIAYNNECCVRRIISEQTSSGVYFNSRRAKRYIKYIEAKKEQLHKQIRPFLKLEVVQYGSVPVKKPFKKDGTHSKAVTDWYGVDSHIVAREFTRVKFVEPDIGSRIKLQKQLLNLGWKPKHFTEKGSPKLTYDGQPCDSLLSIDSEVGKYIALWYTLSHRMSQIKGWIKALRPDERVSQGCITIGTPTYRFRHKTVVNVPKAASYVVFGKQMRSLFTVPRAAEGYRQYLEWKESNDD